jgi:HAAS
MISAYLRELADALRFDPPLARAVVQEVKDHLREAAAAEPIDDHQEAERRAIAKFGDARELAVQFAAVSLARWTRRAGIAIVLAIVAVMVMMKARVAWYAIMQRTMSDDARAIAAVVLAIDRYAFWISAIIGIAALIQISCYRTPVHLHTGYRRHLYRSVFLFAGATTALFVSVMSDIVLTMLQIGMTWSSESIVPIISISLEIACVVGIALLTVASRVHVARTEVMFRS